MEFAEMKNYHSDIPFYSESCTHLESSTVEPAYFLSLVFGNLPGIKNPFSMCGNG